MKAAIKETTPTLQVLETRHDRVLVETPFQPTWLAQEDVLLDPDGQITLSKKGWIQAFLAFGKEVLAGRGPDPEDTCRRIRTLPANVARYLAASLEPFFQRHLARLGPLLLALKAQGEEGLLLLAANPEPLALFEEDWRAIGRALARFEEVQVRAYGAPRTQVPASGFSFIPKLEPLGTPHTLEVRRTVQGPELFLDKEPFHHSPLPASWLLPRNCAP